MKRFSFDIFKRLYFNLNVFVHSVVYQLM